MASSVNDVTTYWWRVSAVVLVCFCYSHYSERNVTSACAGKQQNWPVTPTIYGTL